VAQVANDCIALVGCGVDGDKAVVVEIHSPGACFRQHVDNFDGRNRRTDKAAKGIAPAVAYGAKSKGEIVVWLRLKGLRVHSSSMVPARTRISAHERKSKNLGKPQNACR
jgi:hypothetical protein